MRLKLNYLLLAIMVMAVLIPSCAPKNEAPQKPNVIVILTDDLGYGDVSAYGVGTLKTPEIDKMAAEGVLFTNGYCTSATCTPSRYGLLTGQYPWRNERAAILRGDAPLIIDPAKPTFPKMMQKAGYATAVIGKWHLGIGDGFVNWNKEIPLTPNVVGFDYSYVMAATNDRTPTVYVEDHKVVGLSSDDSLFVSYKKNFEGEPTGKENPELLKLKWHHGHNQSIHNGIPRIGYQKGGKSAMWVDEDMADVFLNKTLKYLEDHKGKPFFLYYALQQPHVPRTPHPRFVGKSGMGPRGDAIIEADWCIGQLLAKLRELELDENTLVVFSSDNGPVLNDGYYDDAVEKLGDHTPRGNFRGGKYSLFNAGTNVPFITYWPGKIKPGKSNAIVNQLDIAASVAALIGIENETPDSKNTLDALLGNSESGRESFIMEAGKKLALRSGDYAYIPPYRGPAISKNVKNELGNSLEQQLYNLKSDPSQKTNLAASEPEKLAEMKALYEKITGNKAELAPQKKKK